MRLQVHFAGDGGEGEFRRGYCGREADRRVDDGATRAGDYHSRSQLLGLSEPLPPLHDELAYAKSRQRRQRLESTLSQGKFLNS